MSDSPEPTIVEAEQAGPPQPRSNGYRVRFAAVYLSLAVIAGAAIGALVVLIARPEPPPEPSWSRWQPTGSAEAKVKQIANQVSTQYVLPSGGQLAVAAVEAPPRVTISADQPDLPVRQIVIRPDTSKGEQEASDITVVDAAQTVVFKLCGLSQDCSIAEGKPSLARYALLRREALELALYTFRYVDTISHVAVFLPPPPVTEGSETRQPQTTVFLRRQDVASQLSRPLPHTLSHRVPQLGQIAPAELLKIEGLTDDRTYTFEYSYQPASNSWLAVLSPV